MTKPKLTDAVKPTSEATVTTTIAGTSAEVAVTSDTAANPPAGDKGDKDSDEPPAASGTASNDPTKPAAPAQSADAKTDAKADATANAPKTLADYKAAFGDTQGCVYFAEGLAFSDACVKHMAQQAKEITDLKSEIATLKTQSAALAKEVAGEAEPVKVGNETARSTLGGSLSQYEAVLEAKIAKLGA